MANSNCADSNGGLTNFYGEDCSKYSTNFFERLGGDRECGEWDGSTGFDSNAQCCECGGGTTTTTYSTRTSSETIYSMHTTQDTATFSERFYSLSNDSSTKTRTDTIFSHDITYHGGDWVTVPGYWTHVPASCEKDYIHVFKSPLHAAMGGLWMAWDINWWIWFYMSYE